MHNIEQVHTQIAALLADGHAPVNIAVNIDAATHEARWGDVTALPADQMMLALVYGFGDEYRAAGRDPMEVAPDEVAVMMDADQYRAAYPLPDAE